MRSLEAVVRCRPEGAKLTWVTYLRREAREGGREEKRRWRRRGGGGERRTKRGGVKTDIGMSSQEFVLRQQRVHLSGCLCCVIPLPWRRLRTWCEQQVGA